MGKSTTSRPCSTAASSSTSEAPALWDVVVAVCRDRRPLRPHVGIDEATVSFLGDSYGPVTVASDTAMAPRYSSGPPVRSGRREESG
jgi:hypothetical protein